MNCQTLLSAVLVPFLVSGIVVAPAHAQGDVGDATARTFHRIVSAAQAGPGNGALDDDRDFDGDRDFGDRGRAIPGENPLSIRRVYGLPPFGGHGTIAIVGAFHWPTALNDFNRFARTWGLPRERSNDAGAASNRVFQVVYADGTQPAVDAGWALESAIDVEWAHAMAPDARIVLVEATSSAFHDLFHAVDVASALPGVTEVSMSWGASEFATEGTFEHHFTQTPGIIYFGATGDAGGTTQYPSTSPNVVAVGGTRLNRDSRGRFLSETGWADSGGGSSAFLAIPAYQASQPTVAAQVGTQRGVPDVSFDADQASGVAVYDSTPDNGLSGWLVVSGTSVGTPATAGVVNLSHTWNRRHPAGSAAELTLMYQGLGNRDRFRDILSGTAGSFSCHAGWDFVTGIGAAVGVAGK